MLTAACLTCQAASIERLAYDLLRLCRVHLGAPKQIEICNLIGVLEWNMPGGGNCNFMGVLSGMRQDVGICNIMSVLNRTR
jgi:hypothetical protein